MNDDQRERYCDLYNRLLDERTQHEDDSPMEIGYSKAADGIMALIRAYDRSK